MIITQHLVFLDHKAIIFSPYGPGLLDRWAGAGAGAGEGGSASKMASGSAGMSKGGGPMGKSGGDGDGGPVPGPPVQEAWTIRGKFNGFLFKKYQVFGNYHQKISLVQPLSANSS